MLLSSIESTILSMVTNFVYTVKNKESESWLTQD